MHKRFKSLQEYHDFDPEIAFRKYEGDYFRVGLLSEMSSDVTFTATNRNGLVVDLSGTLKHLTRMDGTLDETPTEKGDVCLLPPGIEVQLAWTVKDEGQQNITLEFDSAAFSAYHPEFDKDKYALGHLVPSHYTQRPVLANLATMLSREVDPNERRGRLFAESTMRLLTLEIAFSHWSVEMPPPEAEGGVDPRVKRAIDFIETTFSDDISLTDIGQASGLSLTQLTTRFQKHTGATPYSYVIDRRLRHAVKLLSTTNMPIAQVAIDTGFSDQPHLTRAFRARLQKTPKQFRQHSWAD